MKQGYMQAHRSFKKKKNQIFDWQNFAMNFDIYPV